MADVRAAIAARLAAGEPFDAIVLHPGAAVHVADPALGLPPLVAAEIDRLDGLPVVLDELADREAVAFRTPARPG